MKNHAFEVKVIVALRGNENQSLHREHSQLRRKIADTAGGLTMLVGDGVWIDKYGTLHDERAAVYITTAKSVADMNRIEQAVQDFLASTDQQAAVIFVDGKAYYVYAPTYQNEEPVHADADV